MELDQLRYFAQVARCGSLSKASESLYITQSALSKSVSALERELGIPLFYRSGGNRIRLSEAGGHFLTYVQSFFAELDDSVRELRDSEQAAGEVWYSVPQSELLANILTQFVELYPDIRIHQKLLSHQNAVAALHRGELDFSISFFDPADPALSWTPLIRQQLLLLAGRHSPLFSRERASLSETADMRYVANNSCSDFQDICDGCCRRAGFIPHLVFEADDPYAINTMLTTQPHVALISSVLQMRIEDGLDARFNDAAAAGRIRRLRLSDAECGFDTGLIIPRQRHLTNSVRIFIDFISERLRLENQRYNKRLAGEV